ncbi:MAG: hypothetical protein AAFY02_16295 [Pseudomonadota bacterium]
MTFDRCAPLIVVLRNLALTCFFLPQFALLTALSPSTAHADSLTVVVPANAEERWTNRVTRLKDLLRKDDTLLLTQGQTGSWGEIVEGLKEGWIDVAILPLGVLRQMVPATAVWHLPFVQVSPGKAESAVAKSEAFTKLQAFSLQQNWPILGLFAERLILLSTHDCPATPRDFLGRRVVSYPFYHPLLVQLGAAPFTMPVGEIFAGLQKGHGTLTLVPVHMAVAADLPSIAVGVPDPRNAPMTLGWHAVVASPALWANLKKPVRKEIGALTTEWIAQDRRHDEQRYDSFHKTLTESQLCQVDAEAWATFIEAYRQHIRSENAAYVELLDALFAALPLERDQ